ncbi:hypothetical protein PRIPAC_83103 [Pristionchus pacificus]|uniref:Uncharacterized protein n=1 Tax=Pristionchus pacificus TaxID=54126 RepID=A0A2A6BNU8_PRIPA|nr:hypothetical protein PRIPAC_83103 [Pristionchus pacificus]|eukprot:PDM67595.1 hypothetical protein PRIPAC_49012 [Pristionchus pacificus]
MRSAAISLLSATLVFAQGPPLDIPIFGPLGGLKLTPGPDGKASQTLIYLRFPITLFIQWYYGIGLHSGLNIGGNGFEKEFNFVGGPGTFESGSTGGVLVGGKSYGPNSQWGVSRQQGLQFGGDVDLARTQYQNPSNMIAFGGPHGAPPPPQQGGTLSSMLMGGRQTLPSRQYGERLGGQTQPSPTFFAGPPRSTPPIERGGRIEGDPIRPQSSSMFDVRGPRASSTPPPMFGGLFSFLNP